MPLSLIEEMRVSKGPSADRTKEGSTARRLGEVRRRLAALRDGKKPGEQADVDKGECTWPRNLNDDQQPREGARE